jgi:hypothetical protein
MVILHASLLAMHKPVLIRPLSHGDGISAGSAAPGANSERSTCAVGRSGKPAVIISARRQYGLLDMAKEEK